MTRYFYCKIQKCSKISILKDIYINLKIVCGQEKKIVPYSFLAYPEI